MMGLCWRGVIHAVLAAVGWTGVAALPGAPIVGLPTSETAVIGRFGRGPVDIAVRASEPEFAAWFGSEDPAAWPAEVQVRSFFANGGDALHVVRVAPDRPLRSALVGDASDLTGIHAFDPFSELGVVLPPDLGALEAADFAATLAGLHAWVAGRQAFLLVDPPPGVPGASEAIAWASGAMPDPLERAAIYFPYLEVTIDGRALRIGASGAMAAVIHRSDGTGGIWRSPAGTSFPLIATGLFPVLTTGDADRLNVAHINSIRSLPGAGIVPFGARTRDLVNPGQHFIAPVRLGAWIRESVQRGLGFTAIADNNPALWTEIRGSVESFLFELFRQGTLAGAKPEEAFFVRCDSTTTTAADMAAGRVNVLIGFAPVRPAEFVILTMSSPTFDPGRDPPPSSARLQFVPGGVRVVFPTSPGFDFGVRSSARLGEPAWLEIVPPTAGDGGWRRVSFPAGADRAFHRVDVIRAR